MGATCIKDDDDHSLLLDIGDMANMYDYSMSQWPNHPYLMKLLKQSSLPRDLVKDQPYKHHHFERYYWGGWANNRPKGKGIYYTCQPNKRLYYEGQIDGEPNGIGKVDFNDGQWQYEGRVNNGQAHGFGKMRNNKQMYTFQGQWRDSKPISGVLIFTNKSKQITEIKFTENNHETIIKYPDGRVYTGQIDMKRYVPHGIGKVKYPDNTEYIGQWQQGQMHGMGKFQWGDGTCYSGEYMFGKKHGNGKFVFNNGKYYDGYFMDGKQNGFGTLYSKQGQVLKKGNWKNGEFAPK